MTELHTSSAESGEDQVDLLKTVFVGKQLADDSWKFGKELVAVAAAEAKLSGMSMGVVALAVTTALVGAVSLALTLNALLIFLVAQVFGQSWLLGIASACVVNIVGLAALGLYINRVWRLVGFKRTGMLISSIFAAEHTPSGDGRPTSGAGTRPTTGPISSPST